VAILQAAAPGTCVCRAPTVSFFATLAALLAGVGIYGAISFSVAQRTREFGLRIALSAGSRAIISMTLAHTARLALSGAACGLGLALMLGRFSRPLCTWHRDNMPACSMGSAFTTPSVWPQPRP